eukprot:snap_masked-scaffold_37-processed-gene-1.10-mRNA-1 protein AED:1.00 eAED:1.00 QI:0/-1/0/0/-1/1/1/0/230
MNCKAFELNSLTELTVPTLANLSKNMDLNYGVAIETMKEMSSYKVFQQFVRRSPSGCDASQILSPKCYQVWLYTRRRTPKKPMEAFRRALTAHVRGVDGRRPFSPEVEQSLLKELRQKKRWACFEGEDENTCSIGVQGFPSKGFHERSQVGVRKGVETETFLSHFPISNSFGGLENRTFQQNILSQPQFRLLDLDLSSQIEAALQKQVDIQNGLQMLQLLQTFSNLQKQC